MMVVARIQLDRGCKEAKLALLLVAAQREHAEQQAWDFWFTRYSE
jgi:hypothetical protein